MAEIRLQIPDEVITSFQEKLTERTKPTDIARDAMTLYNWAVNEAAKGRVLLTSDPDGKDFTKLAMPSLQSIAVKK
jgi:hypothetical protein